MLAVHGYRHMPPAARGAALAIGNFDGVHLGHQALLGRAMAIARAERRRAGAVVFEPHPRAFLRPNVPHFELTPLPMKLRLFEELGLDLAAVLPFDAALANLTAAEFISQVLVSGLGIGHAIVGYNFCYGRGREGTAATMAAAGAAFGFGVTVVPQVTADGVVFSSSAVRADLAAGDVESAAARLGRRWRLSGRVISGAGRGAGLGFPTANVQVPPGVTLAHGIYAARIFAGPDVHGGAAYFGSRPTFDNGAPLLEVFLLDFGGNLRGREIEVEFVAFLRPDRRFATPEALTRQMAEDCAKARAILGALAAEQAAGPPQTA